MGRRLAGTLAVAAVCACVAGTPALAETRWATPSPASVTASCMSRADACDIYSAVNNTLPHDEVILLPGTYGAGMRLPLTVQDPQNDVSIHGAPGEPRPVLLMSVAGSPGLLLPHSGDSASDLTVDNDSGGGIEVHAGTTASRVIATNSGVGDACSVLGTLTDSICATSVSNAHAVRVNGSSALTATLRNVTGVATGSGSVGLRVEAGGGSFSVIANATNSIFKGVAHDVSLTSDDNTATPVLNVDHSNFSTVDTSMGPTGYHPGAGLQIAAPVFANAPAGNYHEGAGSPTIDAGAEDPANGPRDVDGDARTLGLATDIGADELVSAAAGNGASGSATRAPAGSGRRGAPVDLFRGVRVHHGTLLVRRGMARERVLCPAGTSRRCAGSLVLSAGGHRIGRARFSIPAGRALRVRIRINRRGLRRLRRGPLWTLATVVARDGLGKAARGTTGLTLKLARR